MVVCIEGRGRKVLAIVTALVGHIGVAFFAVMVSPGCGCIGAYRVGPVCNVYGIAKDPSLGAIPAT